MTLSPEARHGRGASVVLLWPPSRLSEPLTIEDICRVAGVSRSHLAVIFVPATGFTPMRHLKKLRLERAMQLLRMTSRKIDSIARDVGFCNAKHFAKRCRSVVGTMPTMCRQARHG